jgi:hypothetical protein
MWPTWWDTNIARSAKNSAHYESGQEEWPNDYRSINSVKLWTT